MKAVLIVSGEGAFPAKQYAWEGGLKRNVMAFWKYAIMPPMSDIKKKIRKISSLAAPNAQDLQTWQEMTDSQKRAVVQAKADQAAKSKRHRMNANDIIQAARADLNNG